MSCARPAKNRVRAEQGTFGRAQTGQDHSRHNFLPVPRFMGFDKRVLILGFFQPAILQWASVDHSPIQLRYQLCIAHIRSDRSKFCPQGCAHLTSFTVSLHTVFLASLVMSLILRVCKKCCLNSWVSLRNVRASLRFQARVLSHYLPQRPRFSCVKQPRD